MEYFDTETAIWTEPQRIAGHGISQRRVSLIFVDLVDPYASDEIKQGLFGIESGETVYYTLDSQRDVVLLTGRPLRQSPEDAKVIKTADGRFAVSMPDFDRVLAHQQAHDCSLDDAFRAVSPRAMKLEEQRDA